MRIALLATMAMALAGCQQIERVPVPDPSSRSAPCLDLSPGGFPKYVQPQPERRAQRPRPTYFLCRPGEYAMEMDPNTRNPRWLVQKIEPARWAGDPAPSRNDVRIDPLLPQDVAPLPSHWPESGFSMLQLASRSFVANDEILVGRTFYTSNLLPAHPAVLPTWAALSEEIKAMSHRNGPLVIISGPIYKAGVPEQYIGPLAKNASQDDNPYRRGVMAVPSFFYRIVLDPKGARAVAFVIPNGPTQPRSPASAAVSVAQVEQWTGIDFFPSESPAVQQKIQSGASLF